MNEQTPFTPEQITILRNTVAKTATDAELEFFLQVCGRTGLDPFTNQIYFSKRKSWNKTKNGYDENMVIQTGIDGYRTIASRTGEHAGTDDIVFLTKTGEQNETEPHPYKATATVYRMIQGQRCVFSASARWDEYAQKGKDGGYSNLWAKMPYLMLGKCAESLALRKAFPFELSGVYTKEEMMQAEEPAEEVKTQPVTPATTSKKSQIVKLMSQCGLQPTTPTAEAWNNAVQSAFNIELVEENFDTIIAMLEKQLTPPTT